MHVVLDGRQRDAQRSGHLTVGFADGDTGRNFPFAPGQGAEPFVGSRGEHGDHTIAPVDDANLVPAVLEGTNLGGRKTYAVDDGVDEPVDRTTFLIKSVAGIIDRAVVIAAVSRTAHLLNRTGGHSMDHDQLVADYYAAMRIGVDAEEQMMALFTADAVYTDPFGDSTEPVVGVHAIRERLRAGWSFNPPDLELDVLTVDIDGDRASSTWECRSASFPGPMRGRDEYRFRDGRIAELHVRLEPTE